MENLSSTPTSPSPSPLHIILFPFMSKGHTIPLLHLTHLLHRHRHRETTTTTTFTVITTPANKPFISLSLSSLPPHVLTITTLPFPTTPGSATTTLPAGVESTDHLPSMSLFSAFVAAIEQLQPHFETALHDLRCRLHDGTVVLISDGFLHWTQESASKFNIPRLVFYGMNGYVQTICRVVVENGLLLGPEGDDELIQVPDFPWVRITRNDFESPFNQREPMGPEFEFVAKCCEATSKSYGLLVNSFYELEPKFLDYWNSKFEPKSWPIGPFFLAEKPRYERPEKPIWLQWLDQKQAETKPVLYVAFGSQAEISNEQLKEITMGLERSGLDFLWALRIKPIQEEVMEGFEERMKERGLVVRGWVEQREVLVHECIQGFLSHCGWNSVIESICGGVPILAWPMMAEQHLNARMVVEEIQVGLRVETHDGSVRGFVEWVGLSKMVKELIKGEKGNVVRKRVKELSMAANKAIEEGGSSWHNMELLLNELEIIGRTNHNNDMISTENAYASARPLTIMSNGVGKI